MNEDLVNRAYAQYLAMTPEEKARFEAAVTTPIQEPQPVAPKYVEERAEIAARIAALKAGEG